MLILVNGGSAMQNEGVKLNQLWQEAVSLTANNIEFLSEYHEYPQDLFAEQLYIVLK